MKVFRNADALVCDMDLNGAHVERAGAARLTGVPDWS